MIEEWEFYLATNIKLRTAAQAVGPVCVTLTNTIRRRFEFFLLSKFTNCLHRFNVI